MKITARARTVTDVRIQARDLCLDYYGLEEEPPVQVSEAIDLVLRRTKAIRHWTSDGSDEVDFLEPGLNGTLHRKTSMKCFPKLHEYFKTIELCQGLNCGLTENREAMYKLLEIIFEEE